MLKSIDIIKYKHHDDINPLYLNM